MVLVKLTADKSGGGGKVDRDRRMQLVEGGYVFGSRCKTNGMTFS